AALRLIEMKEQLCQGGLPRSALTDESNFFPFSDRQTYIFKHQFSRAVTEINVLQFNITGDAFRMQFSSLALSFFSLQIQDLTEAVSRNDCRLHLRLKIDQIFNRIQKIHKKRLKRDQLPHSKRTMYHIYAAYPQDHNAAYQLDKYFQGILHISYKTEPEYTL